MNTFPEDSDDTADDDLPEMASTDDANSEDDSIEGEELSLDQLSQAYAEVLRSRNAQSHEASVAEDQDERASGAASQQEPQLDARQQALVDIAAARRESPPMDRDPVEEDEQDNAPCPIRPDTLLEAILFVGAPPDAKLTSRKIAAVMRDVSPKQINQMVKQLNKRYESANAPYRIVNESGNLQLKLMDDPELAQVRRQFYGEVRQARLSQAAVEVLSIVAYHQPVTREEVEKIRGKPSGALLNQLTRRLLVAFEVTDSKPRKRIYRTTDRFLELFGLDCMEDLPQTSAATDLEELAD